MRSTIRAGIAGYIAPASSRNSIALSCIFVGMAMLLSLTGCTQTVEWQEDVRLLDGRVITVTQKRRCRGGDYNARTGATCLASESWVTLNLPEFSAHEILWHESLNPMVINICEGRLYIVGLPPTLVEFRKYGEINPPYFGFEWSGSGWNAIAFNKIPVAIYDANMILESIPQTRTPHMSLVQKKLETEGGYIPFQRRIDPGWKLSPH